MKNTLKKSLAFLLVATMLLSAFSIAVIAADDDSWEITELNKVTDKNALKPIPLLIIKLSFDANGNNKNDYDENQIDKLYGDIQSDLYGEQYCYSDDSHWYETCFDDNEHSMYNYLKEISGGRFYYTPVEENQGTENDGVVNIIIDGPHPEAYFRKQGNAGSDFSKSDYGCSAAGIRYAADYLDYSKYDTDKNGVVSSDELGILIVYGGYEKSSGRNTPKFKFATHAHQTGGAQMNLDGVLVGSAYTRVGEWQGTTYMNCGTIAHELLHSLGTKDLYDTQYGSGGIKNYPSVGAYSVMATGSHAGASGNKPTHLDPYHKVMLGFADETVVSDGTHTVYAPSESEYSIIRVNTPDPSEYFLIENRQKVGFDVNIPSHGIIIWHIDEDIVTGNWGSNRVNANDKGKLHDPGVIWLGNPESGIAGFAASEGKSMIFESKNYKGAYSGSASLNSFPEGVDEDYNLIIEVLSESGSEMQIKVTNSANLPPVVSASLMDRTHEKLTFSATVTSLNNGNLTACGMIFSTTEDYRDDENAITVECKPNEENRFFATFEGLKPFTRYYCTVYTEGKYGRSEKVINALTPNKPSEATKYTVSFDTNGGLTAMGGRVFDAEVKFGEKVPVPAEIFLEGHTFTGWYTDEQCTNLFDFNVAPDVTEGFTLYAGWEEIIVDETTTTESTTSEIPESTTTTQSGGETNGSSKTIVILVIAAAVIIGGIVSCVIVFKKK